jgi:hypothetical protein
VSGKAWWCGQLRVLAGLCLCLVLLVGSSSRASAHASGSSYLTLTDVDERSAITATWDIALADLEAALEIDRDGDGLPAAREIEAARARIERYALGRLAITRGGAACRIELRELGKASHGTQAFASLHLTGTCPQRGRLAVRSHLYFGSPDHSLLFEVASPAGRFAGVLTLASPAWDEPPVPSRLATLWRFVGAGVWHVLIGYDHVAFLLLLLLPGVLHKSESGWVVAERPREAVFDLVRVVTAFTIAHSITLGLSASGAVLAPARVIELVIAGSIVAAGLLNLSTAAARGRVTLALGFGLVHGFGFASALTEMPSDGHRLLPMLAGFNVGVEIAQLMIVAVALPVLWRLSRSRRYADTWMPAMSLVTAAVGAVWFVDRW